VSIVTALLEAKCLVHFAALLRYQHISKDCTDTLKIYFLPVARILYATTKSFEIFL